MVGKKQAGFSAIGITILIGVVSLFVILLSPIIQSQNNSETARGYFNKAIELSQASVTLYQITCSQSQQAINVPKLKGEGLLSLNGNRYRQPWNNEYPEIYVRGWGTNSARIEVVFNSIPPLFQTIAIGEFGHVRKNGTSTVSISEAAFISNNAQRRLIQKKKMFDDTQC